MFNISPTSEDYPNILEAIEARKQADITEQQEMDLFMSKPVRHVMFELENRCIVKPYKDLFFTMDVFYYGYILGKRAERARHNHEKTG